MMLTEDTPLPAEALPLAAFRAHLHLGTGFAEAGLQDDLLGGFLRAAMAAIEARTGKILLERAFTLEVSRWAAPNAQPLSMAPVKVITELVLRDPQGVENVVMPSRWYLEPDIQRPLLRAAGGVLPAIPAGGRAVVRLRAGMAADWLALPAGPVPPLYLSLGPEVVRNRSDGSAQGADHDITLSVVADTAGFHLAKTAAAAVCDALAEPDLTLSRGRLVAWHFIKATARRDGAGQRRRIDLTFRARLDDI